MKLLIAGALIPIALFAAPLAHADGNADFLRCLSNHDVTWQSTQGMLDLGQRIQNDLNRGLSAAQIEWNLEYYHGIRSDIARVDVQCAGATYLLGD